MIMVKGKSVSDAGFRYIGVSYDQMDCQAFVEQCLRDCGIDKNLAGSNAWYREVMQNGRILTPEECVNELGTVPPGAFLFIHAYDGGEPVKYHGDGMGNASHIGLATGLGEGAIHSSKSRGGVCESKFRNKSISGGWNKVGLWNRISYDYGGDPEPAPEPSPEPEPTPQPDPEPEKQYYEVWSENGKPVNTRKGPGTGYAQAGPGKLPVGTPVEYIDSKNGWTKIRVVDERDAVWICWMKSEYLVPMYKPQPDPEPPKTIYYTVTIEHLTEYQADGLMARYPGSIKQAERGDAG